MILNQGEHLTLRVLPEEMLRVIADANSSGTVIRLGNSAGDPSLGVTDVVAGEDATFGPFDTAARFDVVCTGWQLTIYVQRAVPSTQIEMTHLSARTSTSGSFAITETKSDAGSYQPVSVDLELGADAGNSDAGDTDFLSPIMANILGADLTKTHNYLGGIIGADSITGTQATDMQKGAVLGVVMDGVTEADGAFVAIIDGSDPSSVTRANAAFAVRMNSNNAGSGVDYGVDLYDPGRDNTVFTGGGLPLPIAKALLRSPSQVCILEGAGAPSDGTTGDNFAGPGSLYIDITNAEAYIQASAITTPVWKKITRAA